MIFIRVFTVCVNSGLLLAAHFIGQACNICKSFVTARSSVTFNIACSSHFTTRISLNIGFIDFSFG